MEKHYRGSASDDDDITDSIPLYQTSDTRDAASHGSDSSFGKPHARRPSARAALRHMLVMLSGWGVAFVLLLTLLASHREEIKKTLPKIISSINTISNGTAAGTSACRDPYQNSLGYIWRGKDEEDIRWIPYDPEETPNVLSIPDETDPPSYAIKNAAPPYNKWLQETNLTFVSEKLGFLRNRTIVAVGDSHDRNNVEGFCEQHARSGAQYHPSHKHIKARCVLPQLNFTMANWFHYGMAEEREEWYMRDEPGPFSIEKRLAELFIPDARDVIGTPDVIILNSFYWDLRYFGMHAQHYHVDGRTSFERPLTWGELEWHRTRLTEMVRIFREAFPEAQLMFRLGQKHATNRNGGNVAVFQLNRSIRAAMKLLGVPVLEWAALLDGEERYQDDQHLLRGKPAFLFGNMALYYLHRAVEGWNNC